MVRNRDEKQKTFSLHWGSGIIEEEVQITTEHHKPTIQLLKFLEGDAAGDYEICLCDHSDRSGFQRSPLIVDANDIREFSRALDKAPKLRKLLAELIS